MKIKPKQKHVQTSVTVTRSQLPTIGRPKFTDNLVFPDDITELTSINCSELLGKYTKLWSFANYNLALRRVDILRYRARESRIVQDIYSTNPRINMLERWRRDAYVDANRQVARLRQMVSECEAEIEMLRSFTDSYDKYVNALSRELTRKTHEMGMHKAMF